MKKLLVSLVGILVAASAFAATYTINGAANVFSPDTLNIIQGDTVIFTESAPDDAVEVDQTTWDANGTTPLAGGFNVAAGGGMVEGLSVGTHYYVSTANATNGMKGLIIVSAPPTISFTSLSLSQYENIGTVNIPVQLSNPVFLPTSVTVHFVPGVSAENGTDFLFNDTTITWPANTGGIILVPVTVLDDTIFEANETATFQLINPANSASLLNSTYTLTILNNEQLDTNDCGDLFFTEYVEGSGNDCALEIYNPTPDSVDLSNYYIYQSLDGGASAGYFRLNGYLRSGEVYVVVGALSSNTLLQFADTITPFLQFNGNDALALYHGSVLTDIFGIVGDNPGPQGWYVGPGTTTDHTYIRDNNIKKPEHNWGVAGYFWYPHTLDFLDSLGFHYSASCAQPIPEIEATIRFVVPAITIAEQNTTLRIPFQVNSTSNQGVTAKVSNYTSLSTATHIADFTFVEEVRTYGAGITNDTVDILLHDDAFVEPTETIVLYFTNLSANIKAITDSFMVVSITDTDRIHVGFIGGGFSYLESDGVVPVKVILNNPYADTATARVSLTAGSATKNVDFFFNDTIIRFAPNMIDTANVWVTIVNDNLVESNEQINFNLSDVTPGILQDVSGFTLTIIDDDADAVATVDQAGITIFPNPVSSKLFIRSEQSMQQIKITDLLGQQVVLQNGLQGGTNYVDVSVLPAGSYVLSVSCNGQTYSHHFVKTQ